MKSERMGVIVGIAAAVLFSLSASHAQVAQNCGRLDRGDAAGEVRLHITVDKAGVIRSVRIDPQDPAAPFSAPDHAIAERAVRLMISNACNRSIPPDRDPRTGRVSAEYDMLFRW